MTNLSNQAAEIRQHHEAVASAARTAMEHALAAGALLADVKNALPHGSFETWLSENCNFSSRTARRYVQLHSHRDSLPAGAGVRAALEQIKTATVTVLKDPMGSVPGSAPAWLPSLGEAVIHGELLGGGSCWIVWPVEGGYSRVAAFVSVGEGTNEACFTKRPIRSDYISAQLKAMELPDPDDAEWRAIPLKLALKLDALARETRAA
jgi:hypothetical protein